MRKIYSYNTMVYCTLTKGIFWNGYQNLHDASYHTCVYTKMRQLTDFPDSLVIIWQKSKFPDKVQATLYHAAGVWLISKVLIQTKLKFMRRCSQCLTLTSSSCFCLFLIKTLKLYKLCILCLYKQTITLSICLSNIDNSNNRWLTAMHANINRPVYFSQRSFLFQIYSYICPRANWDP